MIIDAFGQTVLDSQDVVELLYQHPDLDLGRLVMRDPEQFQRSCQELHLNYAMPQKYTAPDMTLEQFDQQCQSQWFMPDDYKNFDIVSWLLERCESEPELQRVAEELLLYQQRDLMPLLCYLKYLVDTLRQHAIVWGVGRGSSVASYVLYLIGVHRVNSLYYDLDIKEFLKD